jgi:hypothetical protein
MAQGLKLVLSWVIQEPLLRGLTLGDTRTFKPKPLAELDQLWLKSGFGRRGGKANRRLQKQRIALFISYCAEKWGLKSLGQLGRKHVENFFVSRWDLAPKTKNHYWYAIRVLWVLLGKSELPPKPVIL